MEATSPSQQAGRKWIRTPALSAGGVSVTVTAFGLNDSLSYWCVWSLEALYEGNGTENDDGIEMMSSDALLQSAMPTMKAEATMLSYEQLECTAPDW